VKPRAKSRGTVLPIVLLLSSMMLVTAGAWLESAIVVTRTAASLGERIQAFHGADSALIRGELRLQGFEKRVGLGQAILLE